MGLPRQERLVYLVFFASGMAGLIFETLWFAQAGLALGNSHAAATVVLTAFMVGLALGNLAAMKGFGAGRKPLLTYAYLEVAIAGTGLALIFGLPILGKALGPALEPFLANHSFVNFIRFALAFILLVLPSTAMGVTLPVLSGALSERGQGFRGILGRLYGWNTLGAVAGTLLSEIWLVDLLGIRGTGMVAALLNLTAAATAGWLSARMPAGEKPLEAPHSWRQTLKGFAPWWLAIAASGFALLALEVVWLRFLSLFVTLSSLAFATMLAIVLVGIALGGLSASLLPRRFQGMEGAVSSVPFIAGALCALSYTLFPWYHHLLQGEPINTFGRVLWVGLPLMFPVSFCSGLFFTLAGAAVRENCQSAQATTGILTLCNTLGAAGGAIVAGFLLIPYAGVEFTLFLLALLYGAIGLLWWLPAREEKRRLLPAVAVWMLTLVTFPFGNMVNRYFPAVAFRLFESSTSVIKGVREGTSETVMYVEQQIMGQPYLTRLLTNSYAMSANSITARRYMKQFVYWPIALHPQPKRALLICFGVGSTAKALTDSKSLESIDIVDISKDVINMSGIIFPDPKQHPLKDPRVVVHIEDGRFFLQATSKKFDLITGEPPPPRLPGVSSLYSREYFQLVRDRLKEGGIATYWLPINQLSESASRAVLRAFTDVFETSFLWRGSRYDLMVVGIKGKPGRVSEEGFSQQWRDPDVAPELSRLGFETPAQLGSGFIGDRAYIRQMIGQVEPLVDDFPRRILTPRREVDSLYRIWFDPIASEARFKASASLRELWPPAWFERTLPAFADELILSSFGESARASGFPDLIQLHRELTSTELKTPVLWILDSDGDIQRIIDGLSSNPPKGPQIHYHRGARHLAEREYGQAAAEFALAYSKERGDLIALRLYSLAMAGRLEEVKALRVALDQDSGMASIPSGFWLWFGRTFAPKEAPTPPRPRR